jgi:hypothetical protein
VGPGVLRLRDRDRRADSQDVGLTGLRWRHDGWRSGVRAGDRPPRRVAGGRRLHRSRTVRPSAIPVGDAAVPDAPRRGHPPVAGASRPDPRAGPHRRRRQGRRLVRPGSGSWSAARRDIARRGRRGS